MTERIHLSPLGQHSGIGVAKGSISMMMGSQAVMNLARQRIGQCNNINKHELVL
jgi:hypothetical protein